MTQEELARERQKADDRRRYGNLPESLIKEFKENERMNEYSKQMASLIESRCLNPQWW